MDIFSKIKSLLITGALTFSKVEKDVLQEILSKSNPDVQNEEQVKQQEIKILSEKRFYQLLTRADEFISKRDGDKLKAILKARGFENMEYIFENKGRFKTDNGLYNYSDIVHINDFHGKKELKFFINTAENKHIVVQYDQLTDLTYFEIEYDLKKYAYDIVTFNGTERPNEFSLILKFIAVPVIEGESLINENEDTVRTMTNDDLIKPDSINFTDFEY